MKRLLVPAAAAALLLAACDGDPTTRGEPTVAALTVAPDERTLGVGETLSLDRTIRNSDGSVPENAAVAWSSEAPAVATVDPGGKVTGVAPGTATIRASLGGKTASVRVHVAAPPPECGQPGAVRSLAVGEALVTGGITAIRTCLDGGAEGKEYVAVPFHGNGNAEKLFVVTTPTGTVPVDAASPARGPAPWAAPARVPDGAWELAFRRRAGRDLARWVGEARAARSGRRNGGVPAPRLALRTRNAKVGDEVRINASSVSCGAEKIRTGRVAAVSTRAVIVADRANPSGGLTDADYQALAREFDQVIWPVDVENFGEPADLDENGRVVIFFTRAVNELTPPGSGAFVAGFFHPRDLFPTRSRDGLDACAGSNYAEILYMLAADPSGSVNGNDFARDFVLSNSLGTMAHELQHLINSSRRLYEQDAPGWEETVWLNEGLSHVAEELAFYRASGMAPRTRITVDEVLADPVRAEALLAYQGNNLQRYHSFVVDPEAQSPLGESLNDDDLATRGATWAFLRYAADRRGGSEAELWRSLVGNGVIGLSNLQTSLGVDPRLWLRDWTASVFVDGVVPGLDARYTQPSWDLRSFFNSLPVRTRRIGPGSETVLNLSAGSGAFLRFGVAAGGTGTLSLDPVGVAVQRSDLLLTVIRTK